MAALFAVGLIALEIVDGGSDPLPLLLSGADGVDGVADSEERLERDMTS